MLVVYVMTVLHSQIWILDVLKQLELVSSTRPAERLDGYPELHFDNILAHLPAFLAHPEHILASLGLHSGRIADDSSSTIAFPASFFCTLDAAS